MQQIRTIARRAHREPHWTNSGGAVPRSRRARYRAMARARARAETVPPALPRPRCVTRQAAFLAAYRQTASIPSAARAVGITPAQHREWLEKGQRYWQSFVEAQEAVAGALQKQAVKRAKNGWGEPVSYRGRKCGEIWHFSEGLLTMLIKALAPDAKAFAEGSEVAEDLEGLAVERALDGWFEPVFYHGRQCGKRRRFSERLLFMLLQRLMPEKYR